MYMQTPHLVEVVVPAAEEMEAHIQAVVMEVEKEGEVMEVERVEEVTEAMVGIPAARGVVERVENKHFTV